MGKKILVWVSNLPLIATHDETRHTYNFKIRFCFISVIIFLNVCLYSVDSVHIVLV